MSVAASAGAGAGAGAGSGGGLSLDEFRRLNNELIQAKNALFELRTQAEASQAECAALKRRAQTAEANYDTASKSLSTLRDNARKTVETLKKQVDELTASEAAAKAEVRALKKAAQTASAAAAVAAPGILSPTPGSAAQQQQAQQAAAAAQQHKDSSSHSSFSLSGFADKFKFSSSKPAATTSTSTSTADADLAHMRSLLAARDEDMRVLVERFAESQQAGMTAKAHLTEAKRTIDDLRAELRMAKSTSTSTGTGANATSSAAASPMAGPADTPTNAVPAVAGSGGELTAEQKVPLLEARVAELVSKFKALAHSKQAALTELQQQAQAELARLQDKVKARDEEAAAKDATIAQLKLAAARAAAAPSASVPGVTPARLAEAEQQLRQTQETLVRVKAEASRLARRVVEERDRAHLAEQARLQAQAMLDRAKHALVESQHGREEADARAVDARAEAEKVLAEMEREYAQSASERAQAHAKKVAALEARVAELQQLTADGSSLSATLTSRAETLARELKRTEEERAALADALAKTKAELDGVRTALEEKVSGDRVETRKRNTLVVELRDQLKREAMRTRELEMTLQAQQTQAIALAKAQANAQALGLPMPAGAGAGAAFVGFGGSTLGPGASSPGAPVTIVDLALANETLRGKVDFLEANMRALMADIQEKKALISALVRDMRVGPTDLAQYAATAVRTTSAHRRAGSSDEDSAILSLVKAKNPFVLRATAQADVEEAERERMHAHVLLQEAVAKNARLTGDLARLGEEVAKLMGEAQATARERDELKARLGQ